MNKKERWQNWYSKNRISRAKYNKDYKAKHQKEIADYNRKYYLARRKKRKKKNFLRKLYFALAKLKKGVIIK